MSFEVKVYSKLKEGNMNVSKNFTVKEFACNDGTDVILINPMLVNLLQTIRDHFNAPITINSAYRTVAYNSRVSGSSSESQHCNGNAADIVVKGVRPKDVADYVEKLLANTGGVGRYTTFTHVDVRLVKARWNG